jgi:hypothetical protein
MSVLQGNKCYDCFADDSIKDKKKFKWGEEDAIACERLAQIIKDSMQMFWEFVKADKEDGNVFHKVSHHKGNEGEDKEISDLLGDIRTQLHKVFIYISIWFMSCHVFKLQFVTAIASTILLLWMLRQQHRTAITV